MEHDYILERRIAVVDERQAWEQRLAQLNEKCPGLLRGDHTGESVLYVGATPWRFQMGKELHEAGYDITLLEAFGPYAKNYEGHPWVQQVVNADVCEWCAEGALDSFDCVIWWHGPEHIEAARLAGTLDQLERVAGKWIVLACPWGQNTQGIVDNNPFEQHRASLYTDDFRALDYETATLGWANDPSTWGQVLAWKQKADKKTGWTGPNDGGGNIAASGETGCPLTQVRESWAVYTANIGSYDNLVPPLPGIDDNAGFVSHICFASELPGPVKGWKQIPAQMTQLRSQREARRYKALSHLYMQDWEWSIWMDAHGKLKVHPRYLVGLLGDQDMGVFQHPVRDCIYDEASAVVELGKETEAVVKRQMAAYLNAGYPRQRGLAGTGLVVRRHTPEVARFNEAWWAQISAGSVRDQLSFDYVCWKLGIMYAILPGDLWDNQLVEWHGHMRD